MSDIADQIRKRMEGPHAPANDSSARKVVIHVLGLHRAFRIFEECGHGHQFTENGRLPDGVLNVENVGLTCEDGYLYSICWCCCTEESGYQSEDCGTDHPHEGPEACWPCPTIHAAAKALGVDPRGSGADT